MAGCRLVDTKLAVAVVGNAIVSTDRYANCQVNYKYFDGALLLLCKGGISDKSYDGM